MDGIKKEQGKERKGEKKKSLLQRIRHRIGKRVVGVGSGGGEDELEKRFAIWPSSKPQN